MITKEENKLIQIKSEERGKKSTHITYYYTSDSL